MSAQVALFGLETTPPHPLSRARNALASGASAAEAVPAVDTELKNWIIEFDGPKIWKFKFTVQWFKMALNLKGCRDMSLNLRGCRDMSLNLRGCKRWIWRDFDEFGGMSIRIAEFEGMSIRIAEFEGMSIRVTEFEGMPRHVIEFEGMLVHVIEFEGISLNLKGFQKLNHWIEFWILRLWAELIQ